MPDTDVAIIGGGPAGSTVGSLLKKYSPDLRVTILEREAFPRDHVGESQLPVISTILQEMGAWDKVEAAGFPIKVGATYRWGTTSDLWSFNFVPHGELKPEPRPAKYRGQRKATAFQVDRAVYDEILLDHAEGLGCEVRQRTKVASVEVQGDRVMGLRLEDGSRIEAKYYVDASGGGGTLRRALGVEVESPTSLRNIAIWDYWRNAVWAEEIGVGGTRVQVMSLGYGWIWFIPLGPDRTSVGLIVPAAYYKESGKRPADLYAEALAEEPRVRELMRGATSEGKLQTTNDWSFVADRLAGENWFLAGDACGFADPILAAGMTLAHAGARDVAYTILELEKGAEDGAWLRENYDETGRRRIRQHIRFADYWYSANAQFTDLKEFTREIARDAGLDLDPDAAFQWLGTGGFVNDHFQGASIGTFSVAAVKQLARILSDAETTWELAKVNELRLDLTGATQQPFAVMENGRILRERSYVRDGKRLPVVGAFRDAIAALQQERELPKIVAFLRARTGSDTSLLEALQALEAMLSEGWVKGRLDKKKPLGLKLMVDAESPMMEFAKTP